MKQKYKNIQFIFLILILFFPSLSFSKEPLIKSFEEIWSKIQKNSPSIKSSDINIQSLEISLKSNSRYLIPSLHFSHSIYGTNHAAQSLFSRLGERSIIPSDFNPEILNQPGFKIFGQQSFYLDWNFYQGGYGKAKVMTLEKNLKSAKYLSEAQSKQEYAKLVTDYALILSAEKQSYQIKVLLTQLNKLLRNYQLSSSQNPVGESGALGLASLKLRLLAMQNQSNSEQKSSKINISKRAGFEEAWTVQVQTLSEFINSKLKLPVKNGLSPQVKALILSAQAIEESVKAEKSKFLPKIGLYNEVSFYEGDRDFSAALNIGAYFKWDIFSPTQYGTVKQKQLEALTANEQAKSKILQEEIEKKQSIINQDTLKQNIKLTEASLLLSDAQIKQSEKLYQNGVISILQLLEVLNRRADLVLQIHQMENQLIAEKVKNYLQGGSRAN